MSPGEVLRSRRAFASAAGVGTAGVIVLAITLATCGAGTAPAASPATVAPSTAPATTTTTSPPTTTTTVPPSTTSPPTTAPASTAPPTTASPPAPAALQLTTPIPPPADDRAPEPVIELGRMSIPAIGVDTTMYEGIRLSTLDRGPGHWPGSAMPGGAGNVVVGGHRTSANAVFRHVDQLTAGDEIVFTGSDGAQHVYVVQRVEVMSPNSLWIVDPTETPQATLFACHPPGSTRERIIVFSDFRETIPAR